MPQQPSELLVRLVNEWNQEIPIFEMRAVNFQEAVSNLSRINKEIWDKCQEEGIDQNTLGMKHTKQYEEQANSTKSTGGRKPKTVSTDGDNVEQQNP